MIVIAIPPLVHVLGPLGVCSSSMTAVIQAVESSLLVRVMRTPIVGYVVLDRRRSSIHSPPILQGLCTWNEIIGISLDIL